MYVVRFVCLDQTSEEYFYCHIEDARKHLELFYMDDSGLYKRIELFAFDDPGHVIDAIEFPSIKLPLDSWARHREEFIKKKRNGLYSKLIRSGRLYHYLLQVSASAQSAFESILEEVEANEQESEHQDLVQLVEEYVLEKYIFV